MEENKFCNKWGEVFPVGVFRTDRRGLYRYVSADWTVITCLSLERAWGKGWLDNIHPEDRDRVETQWRDAVDKKQPFLCEYRFQCVESKTTWVRGQAEAERDSSGEISGYIGTITDLTENKQTEARLKSSHHLLNAIRNAQTKYIAHESPKLIFDDLLSTVLKLTQSDFGFIGEIFHTSEGKPYLKTHTITNIAWNAETRGLYNKYEDIGMEFHNLDSLFGAVLTSGQPVIANEPEKDPRRCGIPQGHPPLNSFFGLPFHHGETMTGMVGLANRPGGYDEELIEFLQPFLTTCANLLLACKNDERQKLAEQALKESQRRFRDVLDNTPAVMYIKDLEGRHIQVSSEFEKIIDLTHEQIIGKTNHDLFPKGIADAFTANDRQVINAGKPIEFEEEIQWDDGLHTYISIKFPLRDSDGKIYALCGMSTDITKRKKAESLTVEQNQILELMATGCSLQKTLDALAQMVEKQSSHAFCSILLLDDSEKHLSTFSAPSLPISFNKAVAGIAIGPGVGSCGTAAYENKIVIVDDIATDPLWTGFREIPLGHGLRACWSVPIQGRDGNVLGTFALYYKYPRRPSRGELDLLKSSAHLAGLAIERQQAEERINKSLQEKELLLKEIHHRTKNNMQIVSSLLWLQSKDIQDEQARELFRDCSNRILSMALVHERMYESPDFFKVDFKEYIVALVGELTASHGLRSDQIKLVVDTSDLSLDLKSGIPCGLLIQELVCNSMKHAFPNGQKGEIRISFRPLDESQIEMRVSDSGVGFPEGFDIRSSKSLGLQLVTMLVEKQLGGTLEFNGNGRAEFKLVFKKGKP
jgi:PAS domain S-box-containing protein